VIVMMMTGRTIILTQCIANRIIRGWNRMYDPLIKKRLKRSINSNPVKFFAGLFFNIRMGQGAIALQKQLKNLLSAARNAQLIFLQNMVNLDLHHYI